MKIHSADQGHSLMRSKQNTTNISSCSKGQATTCLRDLFLWWGLIWNYTIGLMKSIPLRSNWKSFKNVLNWRHYLKWRKTWKSWSAETEIYSSAIQFWNVFKLNPSDPLRMGCFATASAICAIWKIEDNDVCKRGGYHQGICKSDHQI